jgi:hypothetical protein
MGTGRRLVVKLACNPKLDFGYENGGAIEWLRIASLGGP